MYGCPFNCDDEHRTLTSLKYHIKLQHSKSSPAGEISESDENNMRQLYCPFECGVEPLKTKDELREHFVKGHSCIDTSIQLPSPTESSSANYVPHLGITEENNEIRKTYPSNTQGLTLYRF